MGLKENRGEHHAYRHSCFLVVPPLVVLFSSLKSQSLEESSDTEKMPACSHNGCTEKRVKPCTHWQQSRLLPKPATNRQQLEFLNSTACRGRHCRQLGRLCRQCVRGQSDTRSTLSTFNKVDRVELDIVARRQCVLGFKGCDWGVIHERVYHKQKGTSNVVDGLQ